MSERRSSGPTVAIIVLSVCLFLAMLAIGYLFSQRLFGSRPGDRDTVGVLRVVKDIRAGEVIRPDYIEEIPLPRDVALALGDVVMSDKRELVIGKVANTNVQKESRLRWIHVLRNVDARVDYRINAGMVLLTVPLDSKFYRAKSIRPGDHVDLIGLFVADGKAKMLPVIQGVRVLEIDGKSSTPAPPDAEPLEVSRWSIGIEISEGVVKELQNVLSHASKLVASVRRPADEESKLHESPQLCKEVKPFAAAAAAPALDLPDGNE